MCNYKFGFVCVRSCMSNIPQMPYSMFTPTPAEPNDPPFFHSTACRNARQTFSFSQILISIDK